MNLLLINYEFPPIGGGAANATQSIGRAFVQKGHNVTVLTSALKRMPEMTMEDEMHVHRLATGRKHADRGSFREMISFIVKSRRKVLELHERQRFDASIAFFTIPSGPASLFLYRVKQVPYLVSLRGGDVPGHVPKHKALHVLTQVLRHSVLRSAKAIIANSEGLADTSRASDPFPVHVLPNGVDCSRFHPRNASKRRGDASELLRLLFVGRIHREKNLGVLFKQIELLGGERRSRLQLSIIGDGAQRSELEAFAARVGIASRIRWLGWRAKVELPDLYRDADALINPSQYEGMPNVVLEAMATGIPVVASDVPGNRSVVDRDVTGLLFPLGRPADLGQSICRLMDDPALGSSLGAAARQKAERSFSWPATAQSYLELLAPALSTSGLK